METSQDSNCFVVDAGDTDFETKVIEKSRSTPVVVDFWAEWCGPCRSLTPMLERLAREYGGRFVLVKINVDHNHELAASYNVRSIPMVLGFRDGQPLASFVGAQAEPAIRNFLARLLPTAAEQAAAEARSLAAAGHQSRAFAILREALGSDPRGDAALLALAELSAESGGDVEALALLDRISPGAAERHQADRLAAKLRVTAAAEPTDMSELEKRIASDPDDHDARFRLAQTLAKQSRYREALHHYLEIVNRDRSFQNDAGRRSMLDIFNLLGADHELTALYRSELAKVLFR